MGPRGWGYAIQFSRRQDGETFLLVVAAWMDVITKAYLYLNSSAAEWMTSNTIIWEHGKTVRNRKIYMANYTLAYIDYPPCYKATLTGVGWQHRRRLGPAGWLGPGSLRSCAAD